MKAPAKATAIGGGGGGAAMGGGGGSGGATSPVSDADADLQARLDNLRRE
jgi:charged multivesicular body protein 2A